MKHLKKFSFLRESKFQSIDEFQKFFNYLCFDVFNKEKRNQIESCVRDGIGDFLKIKDKHSQIPGLNPYFGIAMSLGSFGGLSYEFQRTVNSERYDINDVLSWDHLFHDSINRLMWRKSFGRTEHGYPYYEFKIDVSIEDSFNDLSEEDIKNKMSGSSSYFNTEICKIIKNEIQMYADIYYNININVSVRCHGKSSFSSKGTDYYSLEIRIIDLDFVPSKDF